MKREIERCEMAFAEAEKGRSVAMICSGDAGVYGMAGPILELAEKYPDVELEVIPGSQRRSPAEQSSALRSCMISQ